MSPVAFFLITGALFSLALYGVGYYLWSVPEQQAASDLGGRLRELRAHMRTRTKAPELLRREHRGSFAFLGDLVTWVGVFRRLQDLVNQADLRYRAADVFAISLAIGVGANLQVVWEVGKLVARDYNRLNQSFVNWTTLAGAAAGIAIRYFTAFLVKF